MLGKCEDLFQCELVLSDKINNVRLLGELPFSQSDLDKLDEMVVELMHSEVDGIDFLKQRTPACLSCLLVWHGVYDYKGGNYWSTIEKTIGKLDALQQGELGNAFLSFLTQRGLPTFNIRGARAYVTPILIHGGIPTACLDEFFEYVVDSFIKQRLTEPSIVALELAIRRDEHEERSRREAQINDVKQRKAVLQQRVLHEQHRLSLAVRLMQLLAERETLSDATYLSKDCRKQREEWRKEIECLEAEKLRLKRDVEALKLQISSFTKEDMAILSYADYIDDYKRCYDQWLSMQNSLESRKALADELYEHFLQLWVDILSCSFNEEYVTWLEAFDSARVFDLLNMRDELRRKIKIARADIWSKKLNAHIRYSYSLKTEFRRFQKRYSSILWQLKRMFESLPPTVRVSPLKVDKNFVQKAELLKNIYLEYISLTQQTEEYRRMITELQTHMQETAVGFDEGLTANPEQRLKWWEQRLAEAREHAKIAQKASLELVASELNGSGLQFQIEKINLREASLQQQLVKLNNMLGKLGFGDIENGLSRLEHYYDISNEIEDLSNRFGYLPNEQLIEELQVSIKQDQETIDNLDRELRTLRIRLGPPVFSRVSKPVRRFLLYGGDHAASYLTHTVAMAKAAYDAGKVDDSFYTELPAHIIDAFKLWFVGRKHCEEQEVVGAFDNRFISPYVRLSESADKLEIYIPEQRLKLSPKITVELHNERSMYLVVQAGDEHRQLELSGCWLSSNEIRINAKHWPLPFLADTYKVSLYLSENAFHTWNIAGVDKNNLCFAFDPSSGKLLPDIPKRVVWLLMQSGYRLAQRQGIMREELFYGLGVEQSMAMVDLSYYDGDSMALVDKSGAIAYCSLCRERISRPELVGRHRGVFIGDTAVYIDGVPSLQLPSSIIEEALYWRFSLWAIDDKSFIPVHKRLIELKPAMDKVKEDAWLLPLKGHGRLTESAIGRFVANIAGPRGVEYHFEFGILSGTAVDFEYDIYFPHLYKNGQARLLVYLSEGIEFIPKLPAFIEETDDDFALVVCDTKQSKVDGVLRYKERNDFTIVISVIIPRLLWWIEDEAGDLYRWEDAESPLFIGLWQNSRNLRLSLEMPEWMDGTAILSLKNGDVELQCYENTISRGITSMDLMCFYDTLKSCNTMVDFALTITASNCCLPNTIHMFKVRTSWRVNDWHYKWLFDEQGVRLCMRWIDLGDQPNRAVQLWRWWLPESPPIIKRINDGCSYVELSADDGIAYDRYICRFFVEDKWEQDDSNMVWPSPDEPNVFVVLPEDESLILDIKPALNAQKHEIIVKGHLALPVNCSKVRLFAIGINESIPSCCGAEADVMNNGGFEARVPADAHWLIIAAYYDEHTTYSVSILPQVGPAYYPVDDAVLATIASLWDDLRPDIKVNMNSFAKHRTESYLFRLKPERAWDFSASLVNKLEQGQEIEAVICMEDADKPCRLSHQRGDGFFVEMQNGVKCVTCGEILPDQYTWDKTHYPKCHSFKKIYNDKVRVELLLCWDYNDIINKLNTPFKQQNWLKNDMSRLPVGSDDTNLLALFLSEDAVEKTDALKFIVRFLTDKELKHIMTVKSMAKGGVYNAH